MLGSQLLPNASDQMNTLQSEKDKLIRQSKNLNPRLLPVRSSLWLERVRRIHHVKLITLLSQMDEIFFLDDFDHSLSPKDHWLCRLMKHISWMKRMLLQVNQETVYYQFDVLQAMAQIKANKIAGRTSFDVEIRSYLRLPSWFLVNLGSKYSNYYAYVCYCTETHWNLS